MFIQIDGQILYYEKIGEGAPLLMLHGNGEDHRIFTELAQILSDRYTCYLLDTRGHGGSATPAAYHYSEMADDVIGFIAATMSEPPVVLGFSDGAIIAVLAELQHPGNFSRMVLCGLNLTPDGLERKALKEIKKEYKKTGNPLMALMLNEPKILPAELSRITCPIELCYGEKDMISKKEQAKISAALFHMPPHIFKGEDHMSYVIHSVKLAELF